MQRSKLTSLSTSKMNCIIVHGCPHDKERAQDPKTSTYSKHWMPWTKRQLEKKGIKTETPLFPEPWKPVYEKFKKEFEKYSVNENTILIGHSCGCSFLVRWLGETKKKILKLILVAPWKIPDDKIREKFYNYPINPEIKKNVKEVIIFTSDNEAENGKKSAKIFHDALGGKIIELKNHEHYTYNDMGTEEFPELIDAVLE